MDEHPKTKIQIDQSEIKQLQNNLKTGMMIPVFIENKISDNYYQIRIKNVRLNAFSEVNLFNSSVFVRVKEVNPIPKLQLIFCDAKFSMQNFNMDDIEQLNPQDLQLLFSLNPFLNLNQKNPPNNVKQLIQYAKVKSFFSLIPVHLSFQTGLDIDQMLSFYSFQFLDYPLKSIIRLPQDKSLIEDNHLKALISSKMNLIDYLNAEFSSINREYYQYEYWLIPYQNKICLCPMEAMFFQQKLKRFTSTYISKNLGVISINGNHKAYWTINIDTENSIFQKELMKISATLYNNLSDIITQKFDLNFGIITSVHPEQFQYQLMDITING